MKKLFCGALALLMSLFVAAGCSFGGNIDEYNDVTYDAHDFWDEPEDPDSGAEIQTTPPNPSTNPDNPKVTESPETAPVTPYTTTADPNSKPETVAPESESGTVPAPPETSTAEPDGEELIDEHGSYTTKDDVALYIHTYGHLPDNFITKKEAEKLGWSGGSLEPYAPGKCIGGSRFGNYEGLLPEKDGRSYTECDIDTLGAEKRGAKRIVFSNDGLIYYTDDHYESFELLYGDEFA